MNSKRQRATGEQDLNLDGDSRLIHITWTSNLNRELKCLRWRLGRRCRSDCTTISSEASEQTCNSVTVWRNEQENKWRLPHGHRTIVSPYMNMSPEWERSNRNHHLSRWHTSHDPRTCSFEENHSAWIQGSVTLGSHLLTVTEHRLFERCWWSSVGLDSVWLSFVHDNSHSAYFYDDEH